MQSLESAFGKALHQPMPFTTGGQTITDRLTAAKHSLAGSQLGKTICKATTEELMAPKKKHCDYLLHCTNEPNVSIPSMANLLIERTQNPNWIVAYKALITIHNLMCYGNERFSQYLASCNTTINLSNFIDKTNLQSSTVAGGYDMSTHVRRYAKYISEKIHTYRLCAFDFCKVKRGRDDGLLRTMHTDKLLKTLPILQNQIDALLEFQVASSELNNGVINCSFILLFRDLIRLFACYNDSVINLLEKFFDMNKKQCREALDMYKAFLFRLDRVSDFLRVAETVGIDRGEIPDLTRAPASLLEALEAHLYHLEGGKGPPPVSNAQQMVNQQIYQQNESFSAFSSSLGGQPSNIDELAKQKYLEEEKKRLLQFEEQRQKQLQQHQQPKGSSTNPFGNAAAPSSSANASGGNDLLSFYDLPNQQQQQNLSGIDPSNPFASAVSANSQPPATATDQTNPFGNAVVQNAMQQQFKADPFGAYTASAASSGYSYQQDSLFQQQPPQPFAPFQPQSNTTLPSNTQNPGGIYAQTPFNPPSQTANSVDTTLSSLVNNLGISQPQRPPQPTLNQQPLIGGGPFGQPPMYQPMGGYGGMQQQQPQQSWNAFANPAPPYNVGVGYGMPTSNQPPFGQPNFGMPPANSGINNSIYPQPPTNQ